MKILVVGDVHGDLRFLKDVATEAADLGIKQILQLGDLGVFWPSTSGVLSMFGIMLARQDANMVFVDGNHEGWDGLELIRRNSHLDGAFRVLSPNIKWADRGARWEWGGVRFGALGGAFSVDWCERAAGEDWCKLDRLQVV